MGQGAASYSPTTHSLLEGLLLFREGKGEGLLDIRSRRAERPQGSAARQRPREHTSKGRHGFPTTGDEVSFRKSTERRIAVLRAQLIPPPPTTIRSDAIKRRSRSKSSLLVRPQGTG